MPPLAQPQPLIPEHPPRLRSDSIDLACSSGSSSFFGRLWPNRRKFALSTKSASVASAQDITCKLSKLPSSVIGLQDDDPQACKGFPDSIDSDNVHCDLVPASVDSVGEEPTFTHEFQGLESKLDFQNRKEPGTDARRAVLKSVKLKSYQAECRREACRLDFPKWVNFEDNVEPTREGSEGGITQLQEVGVNPIMESLKGVVIGNQRIDKGEANNVSGRKKQREQKECVDQMSTKRLASSKAGEVSNVCGIKKMRMSTLCELQRVVGTLQWGNSLEERWLAADEVRRLCKDDPIARVTLGVQLGAIPPLISMLHSLHPKHQCTALLALLNLAVGNDVNKAAIVNAKAVPAMVGLLQNVHTDVQAAVVTLFLSLSAFDGNKAEIGVSGSVVMLVALMGKQHTKKDALRTLYNLSIHTDNVKFIVEAGGVPLLLDMVSDIDTADKSLATLSNFAGTDVGRHAFAEHKEVAYAILIDTMRCVEMPKCQERAVYVLMMIAHHSQEQREALAAAGIIPALVELSLLGSTLAQKRATHTLHTLRNAKAFSAPQQRQCPDTVSADAQRNMARTMSEKRVVNGLVQQSLHRTVQRITRRANLSTVLGDSMFAEASSVAVTSRSFRRPLDRRSSSCSLPY